MSKQLILICTLVAIVGMACGSVVGGYFVYRFGSSFMTYDILMNQMATATATLNTLNKLRNNDDAGAIELCEQILDNALIGIGGTLSQVPEGHNKSAAIKVLARVRDYREQHPRKTAVPVVDEAVTRALSISETK
jgi:hypothetical protein